MEIWVLVAAAFLIALGFGIVAPVLPQFARSFDVGVMAASAIVSIFAFVRLVFAPAGGALRRASKPQRQAEPRRQQQRPARQQQGPCSHRCQGGPSAGGVVVRGGLSLHGAGAQSGGAPSVLADPATLRRRRAFARVGQCYAPRPDVAIA